MNIINHSFKETSIDISSTIFVCYWICLYSLLFE